MLHRNCTSERVPTEITETHTFQTSSATGQSAAFVISERLETQLKHHSTNTLQYKSKTSDP